MRFKITYDYHDEWQSENDCVAYVDGTWDDMESYTKFLFDIGCLVTAVDIINEEH